MTSIKKKYKKLFRYYVKELKKCHNSSFNNYENCLDYFTTYLRYMRDVYILTEENIDPDKNLKVASICMAVSEYEKYSTCISTYYNVSKNTIEQKDKTKTKDEVTKAYQTEKLFHWNTFWEIVRMNMESWFNNNDITI